MRKLLLTLILVSGSYTIWAQEVKGKIVDAVSQTPINAALINVNGTNISTLTNNEGIFILTNLKSGEQNIVLSYMGYVTKRLPVSIDEQDIDLGTITLDEDLTSATQMGLISLSENDLGEDNGSSESSSSLLQASKNPFQQAAAYNWGQAFYRVRGLDNEYGKTLINGIVMNKIYDGRPQWSNWGGLNDATRNQTYSSSTSPSDYTFGGILGTQEISTRASHIRQGAKAGFSGSNANYTWRPYAIYSSGLNENGWAYVFSASYRGAREGFFDGTNYDAPSFFAAIEKKFNDQHSLNFTAIYAKNTRAKNSPVTDEQVALKDFKYNSYWGYQGGDKRNSRYKNVEEPIFMLTHYWNINEKNTLTTSAAYQFGHIANSRFGYKDNMNPDPTYYRNMPSYALNYHTNGVWDPNYDLAEQKAIAFSQGGQVDWDWIYNVNRHNNGESKIILYEDVQSEQTFNFNTSFKSLLTDNITFDAGINYRRLKSHNYKKAVDLLGGDRYLDIDNYQTGEARESDLNHPNRYIGKNDHFGYNYNVFADVVNVFTQFIFDFDKVDFYVAQNIGYTNYQRDGLYRNGIYKDDSFGKSNNVNFNSFGFKAGGTYHITGKHALNLNASVYNQAPTIRNTFGNARVNNKITEDLKNEDIIAVDASYIFRSPKLKAILTGYISEIKNATDISFYYADGAGIMNDQGELLTKSGGAFVSEILTGVNKRNLGLEMGIEYQVTQTVKATAAASLGQSFYTNNPNIKLNSDNVAKTFDYGEAYLKNYRLSNGPQTALSLGLEYRSPQYWWVSANINYFNDAYTDVTALRRTDNFVKDPSKGGEIFPGLTQQTIRDMWRQEKLADFALLNISVGKSWRLANRNTIGLNANINNVLNKKYKTGGFEQARNANYASELANNASGTNTFANKYFYGYGRNFFVNLYYNF